MRRVLLAGCLAVLAAVDLAGCGNGGGRVADSSVADSSATGADAADDGSADPKPPRTHHFSITLNETRLRPGEEFFITYHVDDPSIVIEHGEDLELSRDGKRLNWLVNVEDPADDGRAVKGPQMQIVDLNARPGERSAFVGPGPYRFVLPKQLDPGSYRLCGIATAALEREIRRLDSEQVCADITVSG